MNQQFILQNIIKDLNLNENSVKNTVELLNQDATIPFIARYRKEKTDGLDETQIRNIGEKLEYYTELEKRKSTIINSIQEQGKLTSELEKEILSCTEKQKLEDIYLPYKQKKRTRATIAKEKGLSPLADLIMLQMPTRGSKQEILSRYINPEKGVETEKDALAGALDIIAEEISDRADIRGWLRNFVLNKGLIVSEAKKEWKDQKSKFETYYEFSEQVKNSPSHRILAIRRGEKEKVLSYKIETEEERALTFIESKVITNNNSLFYGDLINTVKDSYKRLIFPSIETEVFNLKLEEAEKESINVFAKNLKNLLLAPPAGHKIIMGVDPGFRTGCKVAVMDENGNYKEYKPIFPHEPQNRKDEAEKILLDFIKKHNIELISIGNGTASKETVVFIKNMIKKNNLKLKSVVVSEAGASVYSASEVAIKEFPDLDVTVRGAISIARRLQDPLAELVKIDPKSIGVGQYQHDVNQSELKKTLDLTVQSCVNYVGVELNTASTELLSYVSGINKTVAQNIVNYRTENGSFKTRKAISKVAKLGNKAFEQCAGFLRIRNSENPLDNSAIHPESYHIVEKMAKDLNVKVEKLIGNEDLVSKIDLKKYVTEQAGLPTLTDIAKELKKPGLDPRQEFTSIEFSSDINELKDLKEGMILDGNVTNVTNFGAFVDIGVHQDGLIHISRMGNRFVKNPYEIVSVGDNVKVKVLTIDTQLKRISLELIS
ncbi:MAG: RNA-binding transcriptional accessory protein [Candidatus Melainabacteria bacterium GWA2_34_9]|nr:MAG: RNA-binding transcriptional accessory protein [Candidatus Melainabacteria bacterium GWA2_34_9]